MDCFKRGRQAETGFTLIEIIMVITLMGVALPSLAVFFDGLEDSKQPEYHSEAVFLATRQMQGISRETNARIPAAGNYDCVTFATTPNPDLNLDCGINSDYSFSWEVSEVSSSALNTPASGTFMKKVTLTVARNDGAIAQFQLHTLF